MVTMTEPKVDERAAQPYVGIRQQVTMADLETVIPQSIDAVFGWLARQGVAPAGPPLIRYHVIDMAALLDVTVGVPVAAAVPGDADVQAEVLPAGRYASLVYTDVSQGVPANWELLKWGAAQGLQWDQRETPQGDAFGGRYESFLTGPVDSPDPAQWQTEVAIRLADAPAAS